MVGIRHHWAGGLPFGQRGQALIVVGLMFVLLFGFAGLALDAGHLFLVHRNAQNAADAAALAAGKQLAGGSRTGPPATGDVAVKAAHDYSTSNGFTTQYTASCDTTITGSPQVGLSQFTTTWFDTPVPPPCTATSGFNTKVTVYVPPQTLAGDCERTPYNCLQVVITQRVQNFLMGVLGQPVSTISVSAIVGTEANRASVILPPATALTLYELRPVDCPALSQCFSEATAPARGSLQTCTNCPTFWAAAGSDPTIKGNNPGTDTVAIQSQGDMVFLGNTTICDPFGGVCTAGTAVGPKGFAVNTSPPPPRVAKIYCASSNPAPPVFGPATCSAKPATWPVGVTLGTITANETGWTAPTAWSPSPNTAGLRQCGGLVLNGDTVALSWRVAPLDATCTPPSSDAYTIQSGQYQYIVINHGSYEFQSGLYLITGVAPAAYIDHGLETAADWDLCAGVSPCTLTAGIWIGHGSAPPAALGQAASQGACGSVAQQQGGGGDPTQVIGEAVTFVLGTGSGGFVSTHEVDFIGLAAPGLGQQPQAGGVPLLFDLENPGFIHLDSDSDDLSSSFKGIIYQNPSVSGGGVEINPGMSQGKFGGIQGQVLAYSFFTFGTAGIAIDFTKGLGAVTLPILPGAPDEAEILQQVDPLSPGVDPVTGTPLTGYQTVTVYYADEWALNAFDTYVKINGAAPSYFSQGTWTAPHPPDPPAANIPGDSSPARPAAPSSYSGTYYKTGVDPVTGKPDWVYRNLSDGSYFEINGNWAWGPEQNITGAKSGTNTARLIYTFPIPAGAQVTINLFLVDGDSCGDFTTVTLIMPNLGRVVIDPGHVRLVQ